jgi:ABC-type dipeptide/oligopeptide/nickel transport system ATPase subunit
MMLGEARGTMTRISVTAAPAQDITVFTFDALVEEIDRAESAAARGGKESWRRLRSVAQALAQPGEAEVDLVEGRAWALAELTVSGYRGIGNTVPLAVRFDPRPGVTVLHGANGSGKSSISDAIETALHGRPGGGLSPLAGTGGNAPLWEPVYPGRDATTTTVQLSLCSGAEWLHLAYSIDAVGGVANATAHLEADGQRLPVETGSAWMQALVAHQPVFAYSSWERRIQRSKDLREYLENLLALGGCFSALEAEVEQRSTKATNAFQQWRQSLTEAISRLAAVDQNFRRGDGDDLTAVSAPAVDEDIDAWLGVHRLMGSGDALTEITRNHASRLREAATECLASLQHLESASASIHEQLADPLLSLKSAAASLANPGSTCPVCAASDVDWTGKLEQHAAGLTGLSGPRGRAQTALRGLRTAIQDDLRVVTATASSHSGSDEVQALYAQAVRLSEAYEAACNAHGTTLVLELVDSARLVSEWLCSSAANELIEHAIAHSHHLRQWQRARAQAASPFVAVWRATREEASDAETWVATKKRVGDLRKRLRERRTTALQTRASDRVQQLLADVGLTLGELTIQNTQANMELLDPGGKALNLGMLSAGQRNAVLLAPLLATADAGPFRFLILDDPVHAFDELRVDRLARAIEELAQTRRVVVLTHDERLREHLLSRPIACDARTVTRDSVNGHVQIDVSSEMWRTLLQDARTILKMATPIPGASLTVTQTIRGLCRQAVDNALRDLVSRNAVLKGRDVHADLARLDADSVRLTKERLDEAARLCPADSGDAHSVEAAASICEPYLGSWNQASHGNGDVTIATVDEIEAATKACHELMKCAQ